MLEGFAIFHAEALHHRRHAVGGGEVAHEVVLEGDEELGAAGIALSRATAAELAVHAAGLVALRADDEKAADFRDALAELDVGAAACHVGGDGDGAGLAGLGNDFRFLLVEFRVEDGVRDLRALEHPGERLRGLDGGGAAEHGLAFAVGFLDFRDDGVELLATGFENLIVLIHADVGGVRRDR